MRRLTGILAAAALVWLSVAAAQQSQQKKAAPVATKGAATTAKNSAPAKKGSAPSNSARRTVASSKKAATKKPAATWRNRQMAPSADRYHEIQDALAARGYLSAGDATGAWNQASIDALKRFQAEQNLESTGKINSLSLIALGLGPKRDPAPAVPVPEAAPVSRDR
jgi:hypothetical protein